MSTPHYHGTSKATKTLNTHNLRMISTVLPSEDAAALARLSEKRGCSMAKITKAVLQKYLREMMELGCVDAVTGKRTVDSAASGLTMNDPLAGLISYPRERKDDVSKGVS